MWSNVVESALLVLGPCLFALAVSTAATGLMLSGRVATDDSHGLVASNVLAPTLLLPPACAALSSPLSAVDAA